MRQRIYMETKPGLLVIISGPSGVGKGEVCNMLKKLDSNIITSISVTTRKKRPNEIEGINYFFKTMEEYEALKKSGSFLETFEIYENYYGTPKEFVINNIKNGKDILLEIDIQGALHVMKNYKDTVSVFLAPPDCAVLEQRLRGRNTEDEAAINKRLSAAKEELLTMEKYDYIVINSDIESSAKTIKDIIKSEKFKTLRNKELIKNLLKN
ncbi:guanylate kinase-related [Holotrichia oblita]|nr:guanylate kinase-related [Holotrichia oblita]